MSITHADDAALHSVDHHDSHHGAHLELDGPVSFAVPAGLRNVSLGAVALGAVLLGVGVATAGEHSGWRLWSAILVAAMFYLLIAAGGGFVLAIMHVTKAGWGTVTRRIPEAMITWLPFAMLTMLAVGLFGLHDLYEWSHPDIVAEDHLLQHKSAILNAPWYIGTLVVFVGGWATFTFAMRRTSIAQDSDGLDSRTGTNIVLSVLFLIFFGLSITAGSLIWLMSLEPHWFSTMFGVYQFAAAHKAACAVATLLLVYLTHNGYLKQVNANHLHDYGKMMFAFSTFWAYIWVSQFLLIWYANIPEETGYFLLRQDSHWLGLFALNVVLNWVIPFFTLLPRPNKRNPKVLVPVAIVVLLGLWLDLYLQVVPAASHFAMHHQKIEGLHVPVLGAPEIGAMVLLGGAFVLVVAHMLSRASLVPTRDPYLSESLHHQQ